MPRAEIQPSLATWADMRGYKLITDEVVFVATHTAVAIVLDLCFATVLFRGFGYAAPVAKMLVPLASVYARCTSRRSPMGCPRV